MNNARGYCNLEEVELTFMAALDFGGTVGTRVFLRCTDMALPHDKPNHKHKDDSPETMTWKNNK